MNCCNETPIIMKCCNGTPFIVSGVVKGYLL